MNVQDLLKNLQKIFFGNQHFFLIRESLSSFSEKNFEPKDRMRGETFDFSWQTQTELIEM